MSIPSSRIILAQSKSPERTAENSATFEIFFLVALLWLLVGLPFKPGADTSKTGESVFCSVGSGVKKALCKYNFLSRPFSKILTNGWRFCSHLDRLNYSGTQGKPDGGILERSTQVNKTREW